MLFIEGDFNEKGLIAIVPFSILLSLKTSQHSGTY